MTGLATLIATPISHIPRSTSLTEATAHSLMIITLAVHRRTTSQWVQKSTSLLVSSDSQRSNEEAGPSLAELRPLPSDSTTLLSTIAPQLPAERRPLLTLEWTLPLMIMQIHGDYSPGEWYHSDNEWMPRRVTGLLISLLLLWPVVLSDRTHPKSLGRSKSVQIRP